VKYTKGKKDESGLAGMGATRPIDARVLARLATETAAKKTGSNPWIDRRLFALMEERAVKAENMCKDLIRVIAVDDGEFLASHDFDYLAAGEAIKRGDV
jgi:hypothetical protein